MNAPEFSAIESIRRPHPNLLKYYGLLSLIAGPFFFVILLPLYFKYRTLHYSFDEEGVTMGWGALFRREVRLNYPRLQDIHLSSNVVERRFGLAKVELQTASGSAKPEMTLEGIQEYELVRDFLYQRMHGETTGMDEGTSPASDGGQVLVDALSQVTRELAAIRTLLAAKIGPS